IHAQKDKNVHIKHNNGVFVGNDRSETVGNDETLSIGHNQSQDIGLNRSLNIGQNHEISIGNDRWERVGNDRFDATTANHRTEVGGHSEHLTHGQHHLSAGQGMQRTTTTYQLQASERLVIQGPGGSLTIDAQGIHLNGLAITLQGPVQMTAPGSAQPFSLQLSPEAGQACVEKNR
ncbi:MAG: bacteriophage T4 gp5 trimerization domain-containing protein, partial [Pseudomonas sp.]|uniref:bacteriophage T4 gp5 trimerisation domain-containing protein n=2 Tax=Pseudomonas TaxID=286 RepID=UPI003D0C0796